MEVLLIVMLFFVPIAVILAYQVGYHRGYTSAFDDATASIHRVFGTTLK